MKLFNQAKKYGAAVLATATPFLYSGASHAALAATDIDPVVAEATADATMVFTKFIVLVGTVLAMGIAITLMKRFGKKV